MLIRSQDKRMIVNFDNICTVSAFPEKDSEDIYVEDGTGSLMVGRYSAKEKAMKVLDMIQEAYVEYKIACTFFDRIYRTSSNCRIKRYSRQWFWRTFKKL